MKLPLSVIVISPRGGGKTTVAEYLSRRLDRLLIVDTMNEPQYLGSGLHVDSILDMFDFMQVSSKFRLVYAPSESEDVELIVQSALVTRDLTLLVEEISQYAGSDAPATTRKMFRKFVRLARHRGVKLIATTQRPADVDKLLVSESEILLGRLQESNDRRYLRDLGTLDRETVDSLADLPDYHFVHFPSRRTYSLPRSEIHLT